MWTRTWVGNVLIDLIAGTEANSAAPSSEVMAVLAGGSLPGEAG